MRKLGSGIEPLLSTKFKLTFNKAGNCTVFRKDQAKVLEGQWVWLVDAKGEYKDTPMQTFDDIVENCLRIWFFNYDEDADHSAYRVPMREIVRFVREVNLANEPV